MGVMAGIMSLAVFLHVLSSDPWEVMALVGPFGVVFGAGIWLIIRPIVRSGGERYEHIEYRPDGKQVPPNGNGHGTAHPAPAADKAEKVAPPAPWKT